MSWLNYIIRSAEHSMKEKRFVLSFVMQVKPLTEFGTKSLLYKLKSAGISGTLLQWFTDYLKDRRWCVALPGASSDRCLIKASVQQGFLDFCCSQYS